MDGSERVQNKRAVNLLRSKLSRRGVNGPQCTAVNMFVDLKDVERDEGNVSVLIVGDVPVTRGSNTSHVQH